MIDCSSHAGLDAIAASSVSKEVMSAYLAKRRAPLQRRHLDECPVLSTTARASDFSKPPATAHKRIFNVAVIIVRIVL